MTSLIALLDPTVKHSRVEDEIALHWERRQQSEAVLSVGLQRLYHDNVHRGEGRARFEDWAKDRFGIPARLCSTFKWIGGMLQELPLTLAALDRGDLTYTKVREFIRLANRQNEAEWIEYAMTHTNRQLEALVARKNYAAGKTETVVVSRLTPTERQASRKARAILSDRTNRRIPQHKLYAEMAKTIADGGLDGAGSNGGPKKPLVYVAIQPCPICLDSFVPVPEGLLQVPMKEWMDLAREGAEIVDLTGHYLCDCEGEKHRKDRCPNWTPPDLTPPESRYVPAQWKKLVQARDGFVCRMPRCGNEMPLELSHLEPYEDGTPQLPETLREHCAVCNDLIAKDKIRVVGLAPYERYYTSEGEFLGYGYDRGVGEEGPKSTHVGIREEQDDDNAEHSSEPPAKDEETS